MDLDHFEVRIMADKRKADQLYSMLSNMDMDQMDIPPIPLTAMKDYMEDKRPVLWEVTVNGDTFLTFQAERDAVAALMKMVKGAGVEHFPIAPLPASNLRAFVNGQRDEVALLEVRRNKDVQVRVKPEDAAKEDKKRSSAKSGKNTDED